MNNFLCRVLLGVAVFERKCANWIIIQFRQREKKFETSEGKRKYLSEKSIHCIGFSVNEVDFPASSLNYWRNAHFLFNVKICQNWLFNISQIHLWEKFVKEFFFHRIFKEVDGKRTDIFPVLELKTFLVAASSLTLLIFLA